MLGGLLSGVGTVVSGNRLSRATERGLTNGAGILAESIIRSSELHAKILKVGLLDAVNKFGADIDVISLRRVEEIARCADTNVERVLFGFVEESNDWKKLIEYSENHLSKTFKDGVAALSTSIVFASIVLASALLLGFLPNYLTGPQKIELSNSLQDLYFELCHFPARLLIYYLVYYGLGIAYPLYLVATWLIGLKIDQEVVLFLLEGTRSASSGSSSSSGTGPIPPPPRAGANPAIANAIPLTTAGVEIFRLDTGSWSKSSTGGKFVDLPNCRSSVPFRVTGGGGSFRYHLSISGHYVPSDSTIRYLLVLESVDAAMNPVYIPSANGVNKYAKSDSFNCGEFSLIGVASNIPDGAYNIRVQVSVSTVYYKWDSSHGQVVLVLNM